ncbi:uncharacterized protein BDV17DRAFT_294964 [Aspergillus undulatus]|uniref:uncharacterized protein n=1 Tax=Aspergillus undulatus TaxID=1810928 RepID=UPI003CCCFF75
MDLSQPVYGIGFEYCNGDFCVVILPHHRHRRCTVRELIALFNSARKDDNTVHTKPLHWTMAQRLSDALRYHRLHIPEHLRKLETELKREWQRNVREEAEDAVRSNPKSADRNPTTSSGRQEANAVSIETVRPRSHELGLPSVRAGYPFATKGSTGGNLNLSMLNLSINHFAAITLLTMVRVI